MNIQSEYAKTTKKVVTRRGVIWLGQVCNLRCHFCYFVDRVKTKDHPEHPFMTLEKAKKIFKNLVDFYHNNSIDIQGGEPTIYPDILELINYGKSIGLFPTLITNAIILANKKVCIEYKDAGVRDFLVSVHGIGEVYDEIVGLKGAYKRQMKGIENLRETGIPYRFNTVLSKKALPYLKQIAGIAVKTSSRAVNFISNNPFEDQKNINIRNCDNVPKYSDVAPYLTEALDMLYSENIECNVRYFPLCMVEKRHRQSVYMWPQLSYDIHEWDFASWAWTSMLPQRMRDCDTSEMPNIAEIIKPEYGIMKYVALPARIAVNCMPWLRKPLKNVKTKMLSHNINADSFPLSESIYRKYAEITSKQLCEHSKKCEKCAAIGICDGFHKDYARIFGTDEAKPITDEEKIKDPLHYIKNQEKIVETEDYGWAL